MCSPRAAVLLADGRPCPASATGARGTVAVLRACRRAGRCHGPPCVSPDQSDTRVLGLVGRWPGEVVIWHCCHTSSGASYRSSSLSVVIGLEKTSRIASSGWRVRELQDVFGRRLQSFRSQSVGKQAFIERHPIARGWFSITWRVRTKAGLKTGSSAVHSGSPAQKLPTTPARRMAELIITRSRNSSAMHFHSHGLVRFVRCASGQL